MTYRKYSKDRGIILIDILLALTLGSLFVILITEASFSARNLFERARERERLMSLYELHATEFDDLLPYQSKVIPLQDGESIVANASWYGNDRIQTVIDVIPSYGEVLTFVKVKAFPFVDIGETVGTPLCSPDITNNEIVGSYNFIQDIKATSSPITFNGHVTVTAIILPISVALPLTDLQVRNGVAYISTDSTVASDPDILVADIRDSATPKIIASINTGPGVASLALDGDHIFAASASTAFQLHIIRVIGSVDTSLGLTLENKLQLILPFATATPAVGSSIFFNKGKVYLGTEKWDGEEFNIFDVSNPSVPIRQGGLEIGSKVNDIYARASKAYAAASNDKQLIGIDVSDANHPYITNTITPSGWSRQEGKIISRFEDALMLGRTSGGFNIPQDHELFSWANSSPLVLPATHSSDFSGGIYGIVDNRSKVFIITHTVGKEFGILNHDLSSSTSKYFSLPIVPKKIVCDANSLYILAQDVPSIYKVDFNP